MKLVMMLICAGVGLAAPSVASADRPSQAFFDNPPADSSMPSGTWADLPDGVAVRPYVKSLTVINGAQTQTVFSGGAGAADSVEVGDVTAVVEPINLCRLDRPAPGSCYATPNRVGITLGYRTEQGLGTDFAHPTVALREPVSDTTVFDVVIATNTLGRTLRWSFASGDVVDWKVSDLGTDAGFVRIRIRPALLPVIDWSTVGPNGCTGTPIANCEIAAASSETLSSGLILSLDATLESPLTGALFATQGAIAGFLLPGGTPTAPTLDVQMASVHRRADGSPQVGALQAFLPSQALISLYGVLPRDAATFFTTTRMGDRGTQDAPLYEARTETDTSSAGVVVTIRNITFSTPTYRLARKALPVAVRLSMHGSKLGIELASVPACRRRACTITVYRAKLGSALQPTSVGTARSNSTGGAIVLTSRTGLPKGSRYLIAVRRGGKLVTSAFGTTR